MKIEALRQMDVETRCKEALQKAKELQSKLNAVVSFYDIDEQLENLKNIAKDAPLFGIPVVLKDNVNTRGMKTTGSSRILDNYIPVYDAHIVEKLRNAGAIIIAKASMDELGMGGTNMNAYTGKVNNPWDLNRISGGSSGGSAVLTACGVVPIAIGTDTGDSIRKPAAYNGVIGLKPTYGRISRYGIIPYASSLDHVGFFSGNVMDAALALEVLAGRDDHDMTSSFKEVPAYSKALQSDVKGKKIAIIENVLEAIDNSAVHENFNMIINDLTARGAIVENVRFNEKLMEALVPTYFIISNAEATANHSNLDGMRFGMREAGDSMEEIMINTRTKGFSSYVRKRFVIGNYSLHVENQDKVFRKAQKVRRLIVEELARVLATYDIVMAPACGGVAPLQNESCDEKLSDSYLVAENHMILGNMSGYPSMSMPSGRIEGLPIGINIMAKPFEEQILFNVGSVIETICDMSDPCVEVKA